MKRLFTFLFIKLSFILFSSNLAASAVWIDTQIINIQNQSQVGRTGQWWCDNHFGNNLGGSWECIEEAGSYCANQVPNFTSVKCGKIGNDGTTAYNPDNRVKAAFGYGRVETVLVKSSAAGRTGKWWCDNHFGGNFGGSWKCRSVSGLNNCSTVVPNDEVVSCSLYDSTMSVNVGNSNAPGRTGQWWCTNHFGGNLGGNWDCLSATNNSCGTTVPANGNVTCGKYLNVDETAFAPPSCTSNTLDAAEKEFCNHTNYMTNRKKDNLYIYNNYVRIGINKSFGGTIFELYGTNKENIIQEHGGAAMQLSLWGYDINALGAAYFLTKTCDPSPISTDAETCKALNDNQNCTFSPTTGDQISNCTTENKCGGWSAASPWNPIQAQAKDCGWSDGTNDVTTVSNQDGFITATQQNPYNFTKTTPFNGLIWNTGVNVPHDKPYAHIKYSLNYTNPYNLGVHNQEMPAIFATDEIGYWYYFYSGNTPFTQVNSSVTRLRSDFGDLLKPFPKDDLPPNPMLKLPNRDSTLLPMPKPHKYFDSNENWLSVCNRNETKCITIVTFSPEIASLSLGKNYLTAISRYAFNELNGKSWSIYVFPYRFDDVVAGKTIRQYIYDINASVINQ